MYFKKIDMIALKMCEEKDSINRVGAALIYIMNEVSNTYGHSYYYREELALFLPRVLGVNIDGDLFDEVISNLEIDLKIVKKEDRFYLK